MISIDSKNIFGNPRLQLPSLTLKTLGHPVSFKDETSHLFQEFDSDSDSRPSPDDSDSIHDSRNHEST